MITNLPLIDICGKPFDEAYRLAHNASNREIRNRVRNGGKYEPTKSDILSLEDMLERFTIIGHYKRIFDEDGPCLFKLSQFERAYAGSRVMVGGNPTPVTELWMRHPDRKVSVLGSKR
jgi:hypothetical protein